jgi:hypothetical protein
LLVAVFRPRGWHQSIRISHTSVKYLQVREGQLYIGDVYDYKSEEDAAVTYPPISGPIAYVLPDTMVKSVLFFAFSSKVTPSAKTTRMMLLSPAEDSPCNARPSRSMLHDCAAAQSTLPITVKNRATCNEMCRPKTSAN